MKKRFFQSIVVIVVLASLIVANEVSASEKAFKDVSIYFWAKPNIDHLVELGAIDGYADGRFGVGKNVTRAESSRIIVESLNLSLVQSDEQMFSDVLEKHWAKGYIETLSSHGIIDGYPDGTFKPNEKLTRAQMAKILTSVFDLTKQSNKSFKDVPKNHWAYDSVMKLFESGMTAGYSDQTYRPNNDVTREQMAAFVSRGIAKRDGIILPTPLKNPGNKTDKYPYNKTINDPISKPPSGATLFEYDRSVHGYHYKKNLPGGGYISRVTLGGGWSENTIHLLGKDNKGNKFTGIYSADELRMRYVSPLPELTPDGYNAVSSSGGEFAVAYGWQDVYHFMDINISYNSTVEYYATSTNAKTFGAVLDGRSKYHDNKFKFKEEKGARVIHSYKDLANNDKYEWIITSDSCEDGICSKNIDSIKIDEEKNFKLIYQEK